MSKDKISDYSQTANSNTDIGGINVDEGCAPSGINNAIRTLMKQLKDFQQGTNSDSFNGPVGSTTASTGAFTTLSASSTVSGTGFSTYLASPPAIGGTAAAAGTFTTVVGTDTTDASSTTAAAMKTAGGLAVAKKLYVGTGGAVVDGLTVGKGAGSVSTNTAVGASALAANTSGANNTAVGQVSMDENTTGSLNVAFGVNTLGLNTTGSENSAIGVSSLSANTTGSYNTALGRSALGANTTASNNTAVGYQAGYSNTTGTNNTFVGYQSGYTQNGAGAGNTCIGVTSGYALTTGSYNTFIGSGYQGSGGAITTGSYNSILGSYNGNQGGLDIRTASNYIVLSDGAGNPRLYFENTGIMYKAGDSSSARIDPATDNVGYVGDSAHRWQAIYAVNGTIQTSDGRQKNTVQDSNLGLSFVQALRPVSYKWNVGENLVTYDDEGNPTVTPRPGVRTHYGFIAQEVQAAIPEGVDFGGFVQEPNDGEMSLRYHEFICPLVKAIQELKADLDATKAELATLKAKP